MGDLLISYDEGVSSTGWSVWKTDTFEPTLLGTGDVDYPTDDCLASKRRQLCHLRRSIRSRKQCIAQLAKLFIHLKLVSADEINTNRAKARDFRTHPWFLAGGVLAATGLGDSERAKHLLTPAQLWDVLRWYAHNRGYYVPWAGYADDSDEDTRKVAAAKAMMDFHGRKKTMAETCCAASGIKDPLNPPAYISGGFVGKEFGSGNRKAVPSFPRAEVLIPEVGRILEAHRENLSKHPAFATYAFGNFISAIVKDWHDIPPALRLSNAAKADRKRSREEKKTDRESKVWLPSRYQGGLLFGQRIPRFNNRIISDCRKTGRKTPLKQCREFYEFRWAMFVANIKAGESPTDRKPLTKAQRANLDAKVRVHGFLTPQELRKAVKEITGFENSNLKETFADTPESEKSLILQPVDKYLGSKKELAHYLFPALPDTLQKHLRNALWRGKRFNVEKLLEQLKGHPETLSKCNAAVETCIRKAADLPSDDVSDDDSASSETGQSIEESKPKRRKRSKSKAPTREELLKSSLYVAPLTGRAPFCREIMEQARREVFGLDEQFKVSEDKPATDPRKFSREQLRREGKATSPRLETAEDKPAHGCLAGVEDVSTKTLGIAENEKQREADYHQWRADWIKKLNKKGEDLNRRRAEKYGEAWVRRQYETPELEKWLAAKSNNHLVRQRMLILDRLTQDIIQEFAGGDPKRIGRIAIEVARDLVTFSGLTSKQRGGDDAGVMGSIRAQHRRVSKWLKRQLGKSHEHLINGRTIRLAKIAEDLDYRDPYLATHPRFDPLKLARHEYQIDHIIPKSVRLTDAMWAVVLTTPEINQRKGKMTSLEFIREMNKPENIAERDRFGICSVTSYLAFVESLKTHQTKAFADGKAENDAGDEGDGKSSDKINPKFLPGSQRLHPDYVHRKLRKKFLLVPEYNKDNDSFTSRQLTNTSYLNRLAQSILLRRFPHLAEENVVSIPGQVTKALRDSSGWDLFSCLGHLKVCGNAATREVPVHDKSTRLPLKDGNGNTVMKRVPILKEELRKLTHLHHAVDASALGLIAHWLPKHGKLWELLALGELTASERQQYESLVQQFALGELEGGQKVNRCDLGQFLTCYKIDDSKTKRSPDPDRIYRLEAKRTSDAKARMCRIRDQMSRELARKRVVQHIPKEMAGLPTGETIYRVVGDLEGRDGIVRRVKDQITSQRQVVADRERVFVAADTKLTTFDEALKEIPDKAERDAAKKARKPERDVLAAERNRLKRHLDVAREELSKMEDFKTFVWVIKRVRTGSQSWKDIKERLEHAAKRAAISSKESSETDGPTEADKEGKRIKDPPKLLGKPDPANDKVFFSYEILARGKFIGDRPAATGKPGKFQRIKGVKEIEDNYGVAYLEYEPEREKKFLVIPWHKVWKRINEDFDLNGGDSLVKRNKNQMPEIIRKGDVIELDLNGTRQRYRIFGFGTKQDRGIFFDYAGVDEIKRRSKDTLYPQELLAGKFRRIDQTLTGTLRKS